MKRTDPVNAVTEKKTRSPELADWVANQKRVVMETNQELAADLQFMTFMSFPGGEDNAEAVTEGKSLLANSLSLLDVSEDDLKLNDKPRSETMSEKKTSAKLADKPLPSSTESGHAAPKSSGDKDVDDAMKMWTFDASKLTQNDMRTLQMLPQNALPFNPINNLSPSLIEQFPQAHYKSLGVSKGLADMLDSAYKTQKPVRIDLSDSASVILRLGKDGRVSAEFLASDAASSLFFKQNVDDLKQRLSDKHLPYGDLLVRDQSQQQQQQEQSKQDKSS